MTLPPHLWYPGHDDAMLWLVCGTINDHIRACLDQAEACRGCCPTCCGPCGALRWLRDNADVWLTRKLAAKWPLVLFSPDDDLPLVKVPEWAWQRPDCGVDWERVAIHWEPKCPQCKGEGKR